MSSDFLYRDAAPAMTAMILSQRGFGRHRATAITQQQLLVTRVMEQTEDDCFVAATCSYPNVLVLSPPLYRWRLRQAPQFRVPTTPKARFHLSFLNMIVGSIRRTNFPLKGCQKNVNTPPHNPNNHLDSTCIRIQGCILWGTSLLNLIPHKQC
jgi:hypothetical protein